MASRAGGGDDWFVTVLSSVDGWKAHLTLFVIPARAGIHIRTQRIHRRAWHYVFPPPRE
ncbi:hypothetical protein SPHINGOT1_120158 [Sphingomonas sp. T1]|nr:hypothetical protein SPHINGOT1_120158 [Sphingomonas sp. T1]